MKTKLDKIVVREVIAYQVLCRKLDYEKQVTFTECKDCEHLKYFDDPEKMTRTYVCIFTALSAKHLTKMICQGNE